MPIGQKNKLNNGPRIQSEKETVTKMIEVYCRKNHQHHHELCARVPGFNGICNQKVIILPIW